MVDTSLRVRIALAAVGALALAACAAPLWAEDQLAPVQPAVTQSAEPQPTVEAQSSTPSSPPSSSSDSYRIRPGDTLTVTVLGVPECSGACTVRPDGTILLQDEFVGPLPVGGCTPKEASELLTRRIGEYVKEPTILLAVSQFKVMVVGEVNAPGQYDLQAGSRLMDAIQRAGGVKDEDSNLSRVYVTSASGADVRYNLRDFKQRGDAQQNPVLEPGDRVAVGKSIAGGRSIEYKVTGAVAKPGSYPLGVDDPVRVSDAVRQVGRWTADADPRAAKLTRKDGTAVAVDLTQVDVDLGSPGNLVLQDGDELFVPRNSVEVSVLGGVKSPGQYQVAPNTTVLQAIAKAGGWSDTAILEGCAVVRCQPSPSRIPANLQRMLKEGDITQNPVLQDRDVVVVPSRAPASEKSSKNPLTAITSLASGLMSTLWMFRYF